MDQGSFLKEQEKTKSELSFSLIESKAKEIFTAHEAACLWVELWDRSPLAIEYSLHCNDMENARRLAASSNADGFTKYIITRSAIDSKIRMNSGTWGAPRDQVV